MPKKPRAPRRSKIVRGNSGCSSSSRARGRISRSAKSWNVLWTAVCSGDSAKSIGASSGLLRAEARGLLVVDGEGDRIDDHGVEVTRRRCRDDLVADFAGD